MNRSAGLLSLILFSFIAAAQKPQPIYSFTRIKMPVGWYREQQAAWQSELKANPKNAYAWYNYYRATRNLVRTDPADTSSQASKHQRLKSIVDDMEKQVPESFEYNLSRWLSGGNDLTLLPYLEKAASLGPDRPEIFTEMVGYGEVRGDVALRDTYARKWYNSGEASPGLLYYNYNVISGLKQDAILLTAGDNDTYFIWLLQAAKSVRRDVTVLNTSMLYIKEYRDMMFKKLGIRDLSYDISTDVTSTWEAARKKHSKALLEAIAGNSGKRPVYIALTVDKADYEDVGDRLYLVGLAYEYSTTPIDNIAVLKRNFEQVFALDYLDRNFTVDMSSEVVRVINCNYVVPMIKLYEHYKLSGEQLRADRVRRIVTVISEGSGQEKEVANYFKAN